MVFKGFPDEYCAGQVFYGHAEGFEDSAAGWGWGREAGEDFAQLCPNLGSREDYIAGFVF